MALHTINQIAIGRLAALSMFNATLAKWVEKRSRARLYAFRLICRTLAGLRQTVAACAGKPAGDWLCAH